MTIAFLAPAVLLMAFSGTLSSLRALHLLQLESYQLDGYDRALKRQKSAGWLSESFLLGMLGAAMFALLIYVLGFVFVSVAYAPGLGPDAQGGAWKRGMLFSDTSALFVLLASTLQAVAALIALLRQRAVKQKKPLVFTQRAKRLIAILSTLNLLCAIAICFADILAPLLASALPALQGVLVRLAAWIAAPVEKNINMGFFRDAQGILRRREDLIKIGITGSYGKTSTKFVLAAILSEKYSVLATPSSFNTPMGLTRVIREQLRPSHQVFLAEMGARHVGDIAELCDLVHPSIGVLTSIGPQHLETFHSLENIASTKFELIDALPSAGTAFFSEQVERDYPERCAARGDIVWSSAGMDAACAVRASDVSVGPGGSDFTLYFPEEEPLRVHTKLLGAHNIDNITLCCAVAKHLGLTGEQIARGVAKAEPVEHRLQLIRGAGGNVVIDDAFNSNPAGAKAALDVLEAFAGRKIVVTPGMVELGEREEELNRAFGEQMAQAADIVILIGAPRAKPILDGLADRDFPEECTHVVASLDEAAALLATIASPGDVTLFENDLPDNYEG